MGAEGMSEDKIEIECQDCRAMFEWKIRLKQFVPVRCQRCRKGVRDAADRFMGREASVKAQRNAKTALDKP